MPPPSTLSFRDRAGALTLVALVHVAVIGGLLTLGPSNVVREALQQPLEIFDVLPPPAPPPPPPVLLESRAAQKEEGAAAPPARKAVASPVERVEPIVTLPPPPSPVVAAPTTGTGSASNAGAAPVDGPGNGAGGQGSGTGSGGSGSRPGGGGDGEGRGPLVIQSTTLTGRSYPKEVLRVWPKGGRVYVAVRVQLDGRPTDCRVDRSSGNPIVDQWTCHLVEERVRFRPAVDEQGRPEVRWYGYLQWPIGF